jgi:prepilin-type N-terminal cleavage/methylation domain-containing protein
MYFELPTASVEVARVRKTSRLLVDNAQRCREAFTLIEILVVVGIIAIVMTISVPFMNYAINGGKGMNRAVKDVQEACKVARDWAILHQTAQELRIRPGEGVFEVGAAAPDTMESGGDLGRVERYIAGDQRRLASPSVEGKDWRMGGSGGAGGGSFSVTLPTGVFVEGLGLNGEDWTEDAVARVRFNPNGTCDEMSIVLFRPESNERRNIWLEVITGLSDIETDPAKFKAR